VAVTPEARDEPATPAGGQLDWERQLGPRIALAALGAALFIVASFLVQLPLLRDRTKNEAETLRSVHKHASGYVAGGLLQLVALALMIAVFWYLYRAAKYRRPRTPPVALVLGIAGPILFGIAGAVGPIAVKHFASEFAASANQSNQHAKDLVSGSTAQVFGILTPAAGLAFAFAVIMTNVNVMRVGLVSTFVGIIGVIGGLLFVLPLGPPQLLIFFWLLSISVVLLDRWPGGRGPAWASGEAQKWPSAMERRAGMRGPGATGRDPEVSAAEAEPANRQRSSRKRKRKQGRKH
jgi:Domain of unknown function (DUF4386)